MDTIAGEPAVDVRSIPESNWVTVASTLLLALLALAIVLAKAQRRSRGRAGSGGPAVGGIVFVEIAGLSESALRVALSSRNMPSIASLIGSGNYCLAGWESDLASTPVAAHAGLLFGDNFNIPATTWFDKASSSLIHAGERRGDAPAIEARFDPAHGLLRGGAALGTLVSGGAGQTMFTAGKSCSGRHPFWPIRSLIGRLHRASSGSTVELADEATARAAMDDLAEGSSPTYLALHGYGVAAAEHGPCSAQALRALREIDHTVQELLDAAHASPGRITFVFLSGYGHTDGRRFISCRQGTIAGVVADALPEGSWVLLQPKASVQALLAASMAADLEQAASTRERITYAVVRWLLRRDIQVGAGRDGDRDETADGARAVIVTSGNLALVSFPEWRGRATLEQIQARYPDLIASLVGQPGIALAMVTSEEHGAMAIGGGGVAYLDDDRIDRWNPVVRFGGHGARHLRRLSLFDNCPDLVILGEYDERSGQVVAFEDSPGIHGGLGGDQGRPFVLGPSELRMPREPIIGAAALNRVFQEWEDQCQERARGIIGMSSRRT